MASLTAADKPASPAPMISTSVSVEVWERLFGCGVGNEFQGVGQLALLG